MKELREEADHGEGEFPEKKDFCFVGNIPLGNQNIQIINPGPEWKYESPPPGISFLFMVGPIPLRLGNYQMGVLILTIFCSCFTSTFTFRKL